MKQILPNLHHHYSIQYVDILVTVAQLVMSAWHPGGRGFEYGLEPEMFLAENIPVLSGRPNWIFLVESICSIKK